jgi:hypothetical protein
MWGYFLVNQENFNQLLLECAFYNHRAIIQDFWSYLIGIPMIMVSYLSWYTLKTQGVLSH